MSQVTIDGQSYPFEAGESVIEVATKHGIEIPYYCWHPRLSVAANCRMCMVEVEKAPKLMPACQTEVRDGMVVFTASPRVKEAQQAVHEFLLVNHPIDCPICDQAGECKLQNYYMKFDKSPSRMVELKVNKPRHEVLGPHVIYNAERCVMCTRCVRFMDEVAGDRQLGVFNRGDHAQIGTAPGQQLDSPYSLNVVDVCPVGALTSRVFRFKQRVWNLSRNPSLCSGCARGCNVHADHRAGQVYRLLPRENEAVNKSWMCDEGRLTYSQLNDDRISCALQRDGDDVIHESCDGALDRAVELLRPVAAAGSGLAAAISLHATCEEAYLFGRLVKEVLHISKVALLARGDGEADELLRMADRNPNRAGVTQVLQGLGLEISDSNALVADIESGKVKGLLAVGHEMSHADELAEAAKRLELFVHIAYARGPLAEVAHVTLPGLPWVQVDGTWVSGKGRAQRLLPAFPPAREARANHVWMLEIASRLGVVFTLPSAATIRAEIESQVPAFAKVGLNDLGDLGREME